MAAIPSQIYARRDSAAVRDVARCRICVCARFSRALGVARTLPVEERKERSAAEASPHRVCVRSMCSNVCGRLSGHMMRRGPPRPHAGVRRCRERNQCHGTAPRCVHDNMASVSQPHRNAIKSVGVVMESVLAGSVCVCARPMVDSLAPKSGGGACATQTGARFVLGTFGKQQHEQRTTVRAVHSSNADLSECWAASCGRKFNNFSVGHTHGGCAFACSRAVKPKQSPPRWQRNQTNRPSQMT